MEYVIAKTIPSANKLTGRILGHFVTSQAGLWSSVKAPHLPTIRTMTGIIAQQISTAITNLIHSLPKPQQCEPPITKPNITPQSPKHTIGFEISSDVRQYGHSRLSLRHRV
jgi:hypothetical protein